MHFTASRFEGHILFFTQLVPYDLSGTTGQVWLRLIKLSFYGYFDVGKQLIVEFVSLVALACFTSRATYPVTMACVCVLVDI